jgi:hypothetical protein
VPFGYLPSHMHRMSPLQTVSPLSAPTITHNISPIPAPPPPPPRDPPGSGLNKTASYETGLDCQTCRGLPIGCVRLCVGKLHSPFREDGYLITDGRTLQAFAVTARHLQQGPNKQQ